MTDFDKEIEAWGEKNPWFSNPQTELELDMAKECYACSFVGKSRNGKPGE